MEVNYLPVGHTHEDVDQIFSRLVAWLKAHAIKSVSETHTALGLFMQRAFEDAAPHIEEVKEVADVWSWIQDHVYQNIHNISEVHSFRIALHRDGWARLWFRESMSTQDDWAPLEGFKLIKSLPTGRPYLVICFGCGFPKDLFLMYDCLLWCRCLAKLWIFPRCVK